MGMKIIKYHESYSEQMMRRLGKPLLIILIILAVIFVLGIVQMFTPALQKYDLAFLVVLIVIFVALKNPIEDLIDEYKDYIYGKEGEEYVEKILSETLNDEYSYIRNYIIPNTRIGDIDGLLVGPKGIIVIEVKNYAGVFRISGGDMYRRLRGDIYKLYRKSPFRQTIQQRDYLKRFLREKNFDVPIAALIVLVDGKISSISGETKIFVIEPEKLTNHIFKMSPVLNWTLETTAKIISTLVPSIATGQN